jgi:hypothetical protein
MKTLSIVVMMALVALLPAVATTQEDRDVFARCDPFSRPDQDREVFAGCDPFSRPDQDHEVFAGCDPFSRPDQDREILTASIPLLDPREAPHKSNSVQEAKTPENSRMQKGN